jgi:hypothetical protein
MNYWPVAQPKVRLCWFVTIDKLDFRPLHQPMAYTTISLDEFVAKVNEMI